MTKTTEAVLAGMVLALVLGVPTLYKWGAGGDTAVQCVYMGVPSLALPNLRAARVDGPSIVAMYPDGDIIQYKARDGEACIITNMESLR
jgi:hypothetical protein